MYVARRSGRVMLISSMYLLFINDDLKKLMWQLYSSTWHVKMATGGKVCKKVTSTAFH